MTETTDGNDVTATRRLDGNAAAGALADLFAVDRTTALCRCTGCGATPCWALSTSTPTPPALVVSCPSCAQVVLRSASLEGRILLDMRGTQLITITTSQLATSPPTGPGDPGAGAAACRSTEGGRHAREAG